MVYDEGFDITIGNQSYFAFNMYSQKLDISDSSNKYNSHCYATLNGWYHIGDHWGCFYATKNKVGDPYKITNDEATNKQHVVEGFVGKITTLNNKVDSKLIDIERDLENDDDYNDKVVICGTALLEFLFLFGNGVSLISSYPFPPLPPSFPSISGNLINLFNVELKPSPTFLLSLLFLPVKLFKSSIVISEN